MTSVKNKHFYILGASLFICLFMLFDAYIGPIKTRQEIITDRYSMNAYAGTTGHSGLGGDYYKKFYIVTDRSYYLVTYDLFQKLDSDNNIIASRSLLTNARRKITYSFRNHFYDYNTNVLSLGGSTFFIIVAIIGIFLFMLFYDYMPYASGRANLVICFGIVSFALLIIDIVMNVFYYQLFF